MPQSRNYINIVKPTHGTAFFSCLYCALPCTTRPHVSLRNTMTPPPASWRSSSTTTLQQKRAVLNWYCATTLNNLGADGQIVADQLGHTLDVSQNIYTKVGIHRQTEAITMLDNALSLVPRSSANA